MEARELDDRVFDWGAVEVAVDGDGERGVTRPPVVGGGRSRTSSGNLADLAEEGESSVTLRAC